MFSMFVDMEIKICDRCNGLGEIKQIDRDGTEMFPCERCNATGRILTREYRYVVPFGSPKNKIYEFDEKIINMIRKLEKDLFIKK